MRDAVLTIFTIPKAFRGRFQTIQRNAIQSWLRLEPACEVILLGDDPGTAEVAAELGVRHVPDVACNEYGTPLLNSAFEIAQSLASHRVVCYINADIILTSGFLPALRRIQAHPVLRRRAFLMVGRRWLFDLEQPIDFDAVDWGARLRAAVLERGTQDVFSAIDYFVFPRGWLKEMPPLAVGRPGWDNWFIYHARARGVPVIDASQVVIAIHQNHDYSHHPQGRQGVYEGAEARLSLELIGGVKYCFDLRDATWLLTPRGLQLPLTLEHVYRHRKTLPTLNSRKPLRVAVLHALFSVLISAKEGFPRLHPRRVARGLARRVRAWRSSRLR